MCLPCGQGLLLCTYHQGTGTPRLVACFSEVLALKGAVAVPLGTRFPAAVLGFHSPGCFGKTGSEIRWRCGLWPRTGDFWGSPTCHSSACSGPPPPGGEALEPRARPRSRPQPRSGTLSSWVRGSCRWGSSGAKAASRYTSHGLSGQQAQTRQVLTSRASPRPLGSSSGCAVTLQGCASLRGPYLGST